MNYGAYNLLKGTGKAVVDADYYGLIYDTTEPLVIGKTYTISAYVDKIERSPLDRDSGPSPQIAVYDGGAYTGFGNLHGNIPGVMALTFTYVHRYPDHDNSNKIGIFNTPPNGTGVKRKMSFHNLMLVEGTTPAAWAPPGSETLAGVGGVLS